MPALSKKQQKFMGIVRSIQKGEQPASKFNKDAQDVAKDMKKTDVKKFASTKHKGLPMKKEILGKLKEMIKQELSEYTYGSGDIVKDVNPTCPHYGAQGKVKSVGPKSVVFVVMNKGKNFKPGMELEKSHDQMKKIGESINEMSAKSKKIISKLGKKEKEMFSTMVDMLGFDQVMSDYKRDKKAFKQALADMSESVITEKFQTKSAKDYIDNLSQAIDLIVRQAQNLKGALAKHPIKRDANKLKAVKTMLKRSILPALSRYEKESTTTMSLKAVDLTDLKKRLQDGKFKHAIEYGLLPTLDTRSYDSNSFYGLSNTKEDKLREKLVKVLRDLVNKMDDAQLENINEDGHTDVASAKRKAMLVVDDANKLLNKLNGMNKEDSLPSWLSDKITIAQTNLSKSSDYLNNPVESVNESKFYVYTNDGDKTKNRKIVKKDLSQLSAKRLYSKLIKTNKYQEVGYKKMNEESVKESMNPSAVKKMRDEFEKTGELPPHLKKFAKDLNAMKKKHKVKNIVVPGLEWMSDIKEVNESKELDTIEKIVKSAKNFMDVGSALKRVRIKSDFQTSMGLPRYTFKLNGKRYGILNKKNVSKPDRVVGDIAFGVMESINEGKGVEKVLKMANDQSFGKLGGRTVDALSAGLFKGVYDKASDKNKEKINKMNEKQLYVFMTKLWSKFGNQVRIG